jgi:hypothetical protein
MQNQYIEEATQKPKAVDLRKFYLAQTGGAIDPYVSYYRIPQRGNGFFGRLLKGSILPIIRSVLPYFKDKAIEGVEGILSDVKEGVSLKEAGKRQLKRSAAKVLDDVLTKQKGSGVRKHKRRKTTRLFD